MGKEGPCHHCGVTSTPLWRNGPPEKPVLCNACGSRWRTKGTLMNYTPLHSRLSLDDLPNPLQLSRPNHEAAVSTPKRMRSHVDTVADVDTFPVFSKGFDEDISNPSSSGSAASIAESSPRFGSADPSDFTGPLPSLVWDSVVPSRKRTCVGRLKPPSQFEKLTRDLYTIFHEQSSSFSLSSDDDLLLETHIPAVSVETGHGSILIRNPTTSPLSPEEESESSSLSVEKRPNYPSDGRPPPSSEQPPPHMDRLQHERLLIPGSLDLPVPSVDLNKIVQIERLGGHFMEEERLQLSNLIPSLHTSNLNDGDLEP